MSTISGVNLRALAAHLFLAELDRLDGIGWTDSRHARPPDSREILRGSRERSVLETFRFPRPSKNARLSGYRAENRFASSFRQAHDSAKSANPLSTPSNGSFSRILFHFDSNRLSRKEL